MGVLEGVLLAAALIGAGWAGYNAGWEAREARQGKLEAATKRRLFELSLILSNHDEAELAKLDEEFGCDALGRLRALPQEKLADLRAGKWRLFEELSDYLAVQERRSARLRRQLEAHPDVDAATKALFCSAMV